MPRGRRTTAHESVAEPEPQPLLETDDDDDGLEETISEPPPIANCETGTTKPRTSNRPFGGRKFVVTYVVIWEDALIRGQKEIRERWVHALMLRQRNISGVLHNLLQKKAEEAEGLRYVRDALLEEVAELESREETISSSYELAGKLMQQQRAQDGADVQTSDGLFDHLNESLVAESLKRKEAFRVGLGHLKNLTETMARRAAESEESQPVADDRDVLDLMAGAKDLAGLVESVLKGFLHGEDDGYVSVKKYCPAMVMGMVNAGIVVFHSEDPMRIRLGMEREAKLPKV